MSCDFLFFSQNKRLSHLAYRIKLASSLKMLSVVRIQINPANRTITTNSDKTYSALAQNSTMLVHGTQKKKKNQKHYVRTDKYVTTDCT